MHPAFSLIVFTVLSGAGFGAMAVAAMMPGFLGATGFQVSFTIGFVLAGLGLCGSVAHLKSPWRARFALSQWRTSWLSREGVLALATMLAGAGILGLSLSGRLSTPQWPLDIAVPWALALPAAVTVWCTGMIYQSLAAVPTWSRQPTSLMFLLFAAVSGGLIGLAAAGQASNRGYGVMLFLLFALWYLRLTIWSRTDRQPPTADIAAATGLTGDGLRLFERPHVTENWLTREMGYRVARRHAQLLRALAVGLGGVAPGILVALPMAGLAPHEVCWAAAALHLPGVMVERWLFFAEARHVQSLYYGDQAV